MSRRINTQARSAEAIVKAEAALALFKSIACSDDPEISHGDGEMYKMARKMLLTAIKFAWPNINAERVYMMWVEGMGCSETLWYTVNYIRETNTYSYSRY